MRLYLTNQQVKDENQTFKPQVLPVENPAINRTRDLTVCLKLIDSNNGPSTYHFMLSFHFKWYSLGLTYLNQYTVRYKRFTFNFAHVKFSKNKSTKFHQLGSLSLHLVEQKKITIPLHHMAVLTSAWSYRSQYTIM